MPSLRQLQGRVKTFKDFQKVVNIQKIVVTKEVMKWKKLIEQVQFRRKFFASHLVKMANKYHIYDNSLFDLEKTNIPVKRNLFFILPNPSIDKLGDYVGKLISEFIRKNTSPNDLFVVIGNQFLNELQKSNVRIIKVMDGESLDNNDIYDRISFMILRGYQDMLFHKASFVFLNTIEKKIVQNIVFPIAPGQVDFSNEEKAKLTDDLKLMIETDICKVQFFKDIEKVSSHLLNSVLNMQVYGAMIEYRLSIAMRELQSLDDKEKNIKTEIENIKLLMQRVRKDSITNELLTNAVAFAAISMINEEEEVA